MARRRRVVQDKQFLHGWDNAAARCPEAGQGLIGNIRARASA